MLIIYGIPNCDTMKKAFDWLKARGVAYRFHDYKQSGIDAAHVEAWIHKAGLDQVLNKVSTTFKALPENVRKDVTQEAAIALMTAQPSMIRRPLIDINDHILTGFKPAAIARLEAELGL